MDGWYFACFGISSISWSVLQKGGGKSGGTMWEWQPPSLIVEMKRVRRPHHPLVIWELVEERASTFKYLGVHTSRCIFWGSSGSLPCWLRSSGLSTDAMLRGSKPAVSLCGTAVPLSWITNTCREWERNLRGSSGLHYPLCSTFTTAEFTWELPSLSKSLWPQIWTFHTSYKITKWRNSSFKNFFFPSAIRLYNS